MEEAIKQVVEKNKKEADAAKAADDAKTKAAEIEDTLKAKANLKMYKEKVAAIENETIAEHAAEEKEREQNRKESKDMNAEQWTANMPETYLRGYIGLEEDNMDDVQEDELSDEDEDDEEEADSEGEGDDDEDENKPKDAQNLQEEDESNDDEEDDEDDDEDSEDDDDSESDGEDEDGDGDKEGDDKKEEAPAKQE